MNLMTGDANPVAQAAASVPLAAMQYKTAIKPAATVASNVYKYARGAQAAGTAAKGMAAAGGAAKAMGGIGKAMGAIGGIGRAATASGWGAPVGMALDGLSQGFDVYSKGSNQYFKDSMSDYGKMLTPWRRDSWQGVFNNPIMTALSPAKAVATAGTGLWEGGKAVGRGIGNAASGIYNWARGSGGQQPQQQARPPQQAGPPQQQQMPQQAAPAAR